MLEENKNTFLIKRESGMLSRVSKTLEITDKLLTKPKNSLITKYKSVNIGNQEWMIENLNVDYFRNGDVIPEAKTEEEWDELGLNEKPAYCYYDINSDYGNIFGKLYNWFAVNDPRNICPTGWHVPTIKEWNILISYLGGESIAGGRLKEKGCSHWIEPNTGATNECLFKALPGGNVGRRFVSDCLIDLFRYMGLGSYFWTSTSFETGCAEQIYIYHNSSMVESINELKSFGVSVRCIKDKNII